MKFGSLLWASLIAAGMLSLVIPNADAAPGGNGNGNGNGNRGAAGAPAGTGTGSSNNGNSGGNGNGNGNGNNGGSSGSGSTTTGTAGSGSSNSSNGGGNGNGNGNNGGSSGSGGTSSSLQTCSSGTVTAFGLGGYTSCIGAFSGNDVTDGGPGDALYDKLVSGVFDGITTDWEILEKVDAGKSGSVFNWGETSEGQGTWSVSSALTGPFVLSLKAGNTWSAYYFANEGDASITGGLWNTLGVSPAGNGSNGKALSHATIYRSVQPPAPPPPSQEIPEPATTAALGLFTVGALGALKKGVSRR